MKAGEELQMLESRYFPLILNCKKSVLGSLHMFLSYLLIFLVFDVPQTSTGHRGEKGRTTCSKKLLSDYSRDFGDHA